MAKLSTTKQLVNDIKRFKGTVTAVTWKEGSKLTSRIAKHCNNHLDGGGKGDASLFELLAVAMDDAEQTRLCQAIKNAAYLCCRVVIKMDEHGCYKASRNKSDWDKADKKAIAGYLAKLLDNDGLKQKTFLPARSGGKSSKGKGGSKNRKVVSGIALAFTEVQAKLIELMEDDKCKEDALTLDKNLKLFLRDMCGEIGLLLSSVDKASAIHFFGLREVAIMADTSGTEVSGAVVKEEDDAPKEEVDNSSEEEVDTSPEDDDDDNQIEEIDNPEEGEEEKEAA